MHAPRTALWPASTATSICSSVKKSQKPSIMRMASLVPAITRSSRLSLICSMLGFTIGAAAPRGQPTRTPATGLESGMSEMAAAAPAAVMASASGACVPPQAINSCSTCVSQKKPSAKTGRRGRSTSREMSTSLSRAFPSRFTNPEDVVPAALKRSW